MSIATSTAISVSGASLIGDADVEPGGASFRAVDPATGIDLDPAYGEAGPAEVARAAELAAAAFPDYRQTTADVRAAFLESIAANIEALGAVLGDRVTAETGLPAGRVAGETARTVGQLRLFAAVVRDGGWRQLRLDPALPNRTPLPRPDLRQRAVPIGPVAVFGASNFPLAFSVAGGDTVSAFAAGCPVIVKGHPAHPGTSELVGRAIRDAVREHGLPEGTFSLVQGASHEIGLALVTDPRVKAVAFTGSRAAGLVLTAAAQLRPEPIPVYAEMSAVNPVFVLPGALAERPVEIADGFVAAVTGSAGQLCTKPGLLFVWDGSSDGSGVEAFLAAAAKAATAVPAVPMLTPAIGQAYRRGAERLADTPGVATVAVGAGDPSDSGVAQLCCTDGATFLAEPELAEEVFGPVALIVRLRDQDQLDAVVAGLEGQLTATLQLAEADHWLAAELLERLELLAGRIIVNGWPTGVDVGHAMVHGGPFPATSAPATTSVGSRAIERFLRPVVYQNVPEDLQPPELRTDHPPTAPRLVDGRPEA